MKLTEDMKYLLINIIAKEIEYETNHVIGTERFLQLLDLFEWAKKQDTLPFA